VKAEDKPTLPFTPEEMFALLETIPRLYTDRRGLNGNSPEVLRSRVTALLLLLRYSGLRIGDAVSLERTRLSDDGRIFLYMAKTGNPVRVLVPRHVAKMLQELCNTNPRYFFWTGNGLLKSAVADWQRTFRRLFKLAAPDKRCYPHMFRDTFAVEMLLAGVPLDQVAMLLGHSSVKITEKHYAPWIRARQAQLEESVRMAWAADPLVVGESALTSATVN
jgi:integrase/recombinase XerD